MPFTSLGKSLWVLLASCFLETRLEYTENLVLLTQETCYGYFPGTSLWVLFLCKHLLRAFPDAFANTSCETLAAPTLQALRKFLVVILGNKLRTFSRKHVMGIPRNSTGDYHIGLGDAQKGLQIANIGLGGRQNDTV